MSDTGRDPEEKAKELGLVVRYPEPNELFVDIDSEYALKRFDELWKIFAEHYTPTVPLVEIADTLPDPFWSRTPSPSGKPGHYHVVVVLPKPIEQEERIVLQAMLGSDTKRELLAYLVDSRSCFFERPDPLPIAGRVPA